MTSSPNPDAVPTPGGSDPGRESALNPFCDEGGNQEVPRSLFRKVDWLTFLITFLSVWIGYYFTLAPEVTLEDSGELAVGSFYAGIPHPPGYPVWTLYTWLWTVLLPFGNVAWRVALGGATGGALAAGLLGLLVSRGGSLMIEGIEELKAMSGRWENAICMVSGFVAGNLIGFNGFMWSQSVIVEVYPLSVASFMVTMVCLMRWIYSPHRYRFLYLAMFFFGICFTNHQTLIVAAMGIEVAIAAADSRMGRNLFLGNSIIYLAGLILKQQHLLATLDQNPAIFSIFNVVGVCSIAAYLGFVYFTRPGVAAPESSGGGLDLLRDGALTATLLLAAASTTLGKPVLLLSFASLTAFLWLAWRSWSSGREWLVVVLCGLCWLAGAAFYFYMPLAGMTNPPMQWGYPRTVEGFIHAFTRGQYEKANPTDIMGDPLRFVTQLSMMFSGIVEEFNWVFVFMALVPFFFFMRLHRRERAWLIGVTAIYLCLGVLLLILLNPPPDRAAQELVRVFFGASHTMIALLVGYGTTLVAAYMATHYERFRSWGVIGGSVAVALALYTVSQFISTKFFGEMAEVPPGQLVAFVISVFTKPDQFGLSVYGGLLLILLCMVFVVAVVKYRNKAPLGITLAVFALMPLYSFMTHWSDNEQRNHWFGYWFGHDMFSPPFKGEDGKPLFPEMARDAILFGGTDPGRFCPTYMIFAESFTPHKEQPELDQKFDRRDVYIITQNALADGTYLCYIRAHYNRSQQIDPPFFQELVRSQEEREKGAKTNLLSSSLRPLDTHFTGIGDRMEMGRRTFTSWFQEDHFKNLPALVSRLKAGKDQDPVSKFIREQLSPQTRALVDAVEGSPALRSALTSDLNRILERELKVIRQLRGLADDRLAAEAGNRGVEWTNRIQQLDRQLKDLSRTEPLYTPEKFKNVVLSDYLRGFLSENPQSHTRIRLNRLLLEAAYPQEIATSLGGIYPDREIYIPNPEDSSRCFQEYVMDAQRRLESGQLKPGEDVRVQDGKVQVGGQVAVMAINGLLTKVIFDKNPKNEFYVEESFPLDWMYPHLTPNGVIMKINREPLKEMPEDVIAKDHRFWREYSSRLSGDFIDYNTSVKEITDFVERVYLRRDFTGFKGDRKFIRDDQAQKAFSKLRSAIGGVYSWRAGMSKPGSGEHERMMKEADFALRQAFAFCPFSPEAVFRYVTLLAASQRIDDAILIAATCRRLDPFSAQISELEKRLRSMKSQPGTDLNNSGIHQLEEAVKKDSANFQAGLNLASAYLQSQQAGRARQVLDDILNHPKAGANALRALIQAYLAIGETNQIQTVVTRLESLHKLDRGKDLHVSLGLAEGFALLQRHKESMILLDEALKNPVLDPNSALSAAQLAASAGDYVRLEHALETLTRLAPDAAEAWFDLAALRSSRGQMVEAMASLSKAIDLNRNRLQKDPKARDLTRDIREDPRFEPLRNNPEFQRLLQK